MVGELPGLGLMAIHRSAADNIWAVGGGPQGNFSGTGGLVDQGTATTISHWNGSEWQLMTDTEGPGLRDVFVVSETDAWAVGEDGLILRFRP